jgi:alpha-tubulin suppressor-like RCC1 family protein
MVPGSVAMRSDPGDHEANDYLGIGKDYYFVTGGSVRFLLYDANGGVQIVMESSASPRTEFTFGFAAPGNGRLVPGEYHNIEEFPFQSPDAPGMRIANNPVCNSYPPLTGSFTVIEASYDAEGHIQRFDATFEQRCYGMTAALRGHVRAGIAEPVAPYPVEPEVPAVLKYTRYWGPNTDEGLKYRWATPRGKELLWYRDRNRLHVGVGKSSTTIDLSVPTGNDFAVGHYPDAIRWTFNLDRPGIHVDAAVGCYGEFGSFEVLDLHYNSVGQPDRLHVTFDQKCSDDNGGIQGELRIGTPELYVEPTHVASSWGAGLNGVLGTGRAFDLPWPSKLGTTSEYGQVAGGLLHNLAVTKAGKVEAWGYNATGQLGNGGVADQTRPVKLGITGVRAVSAGWLHSVALKQDGTVWTWGNNALGQLGTGTGADSWLPRQVEGLAGVKQVSAGPYHTLALKEDGTVWSWGWNALGTLGDGSVEMRVRPVRVSGLVGVEQVAAGGFHNVAVVKVSDLPPYNSVWTWGWNAFGQLGDGTRVDRRQPVQIKLSDVQMVTAGLLDSHVLYPGAGVRGWGSNILGQLGDGSTADRLVPTHMECDPNPEGEDCPTGFVSISTGAYHTVGVTFLGQAWAWGWNGFGQLGDGTFQSRTTPVRLRGLRDVGPISAGYLHSLAVEYTPAL